MRSSRGRYGPASRNMECLAFISLITGYGRDTASGLISQDVSFAFAGHSTWPEVVGKDFGFQGMDLTLGSWPEMMGWNKVSQGCPLRGCTRFLIFISFYTIFTPCLRWYSSLGALHNNNVNPMVVTAVKVTGNWVCNCDTACKSAAVMCKAHSRYCAEVYNAQR